MGGVEPPTFRFQAEQPPWSGSGDPGQTTTGVGEMRFHDLQHTCVTLLLNLNVPLQVVRDIVGHSDIEVTMTVYAHVSLDDKHQALGELSETLQ